MFHIMLKQQLCGKHDVSQYFQDEKYFKKKLELRRYRSSCSVNKIFSQSPLNSLQKAYTYNSQVFESTVACKISNILPCHNKILYSVLGEV